MELFVRLIGNPRTKSIEIDETNHLTKEVSHATSQTPCFDKSASKTKNEILNERLDAYMKETCAWRNPDLSLNALASALCTNRTTLAQVIQECGYKNYTFYINNLRIRDFIQQVESNQVANFQEAFFDAGFRSRATALRNFRQITGMIPSEYFLDKTP
jgi:YesN/AraC family two-component response regulator